MLKHTTRRRALGTIVGVVSVAALLAACSTLGITSGLTLSGVVSIADVNGVKRTTTANQQGVYVLDATGLTAPLLLSAVEAGNANCNDSAKPWAKCMGALVTQLAPKQTVANINALTDKVVSDVAQGLKFKGAQGLIDSGRTSGVTVEKIQASTAALRPSILQALKDVGVADAEYFDPVSIPIKADRTGVDALPWYATQSLGTGDKPDTTHFQERGARAVAQMVAQGIRETPELASLTAKLK